MREKLEYFLSLFAIKMAKYLPKKALYFFLDRVSVLLFYTLKSRRKIAIRNLKNAFNHLSQKEASLIAKKSFQSIAKTLAECLLLINDRIKIDDLFQNQDVVLSKVEKIIKNSTNGIIFFTAHFGNWEILTQYVAKSEFPQLIVTRESDNSLIEENIVSKFRNKYGNEMIYKNSAMSAIIKKIKKNGIVGILTDLKSAANGILVPFFGNDCYTAKTIASIYIKYQPTIIPIFAKRMPNGKYELVLKEFIKPNLTDDKETNIKQITTNCNLIYEEIIRESPEQWFWMHNRWKL